MSIFIYLLYLFTDCIPSNKRLWGLFNFETLSRALFEWGCLKQESSYFKRNKKKEKKTIEHFKNLLYTRLWLDSNEPNLFICDR